MPKPKWVLVGLAAALLAATVGLAFAAPPPNALEASVRSYAPSSIVVRSFPARNALASYVPDEAWRVVHRTGNCCENYIATTSAGRIMDFGGSYLRFSDDQGASWSEVLGLGPLYAGEGAATEAPNGDIVGATWDPYSGDRLEGFKFDKADGKWYFVHNQLHTPMFDRPYVAALPGPWAINGSTVPYLTYLIGGLSSMRNSYFSSDGLNYLPTPAPFPATGTPKSKALPVVRDGKADVLQPLTVAGVVPIPGGGALAWSSPGSDAVSDLSILEPPSTTWSPFSLPGSDPFRGRLLADSAGRWHNVFVAQNSFTYRISTDGGATWTSTVVPLPNGYEAVMPQFSRFWDFKANGPLNMGVVSMYARNISAGTDQNLVFVLSTTAGRPVYRKLLFAGRGDKLFGAGLTASDRLDFVTVGILPDGRIATTFLDGEYASPAVAITIDSQESSSFPDPSPLPTVTPGPEPTPSEGEVDRTPPSISDLRDGPDPFTPNGDGRKDRTKIRFTLSEDAMISAAIFDRRGRLVKTIKSETLFESGEHTLVWGGRNRGGRRAQPGRYTYRIEAVDAAGNGSGLHSGKVRLRIP